MRSRDPMFKRRVRHSRFHKVREFFWPSMGWLRTVHYYRHRLFRTGDSTYKITAGLAAGACVSFSPLLGTHILQALVVSWILRANWAASLVGTLFGNPWTFPVLFWASYRMGAQVLDLFGIGRPEKDSSLLGATPDSVEIVEDSMAFWQFLFANPFHVFLPMALGGLICGVLFWPVAYGLLYYPVRRARKIYRKERLRRIYRAAARGSRPRKIGKKNPSPPLQH